MSEPVNNSRSGAGSTSALNERSSSEKQPPPRWAMVADLGRCVGCQTCTAACKHTNATAPGVQWRKVLDFEVGEFPHVQRAFVPVGCMHCDDPPCMDVCPSRATKKRGDGLVTIDYDICIGCAYCAVACPFQARWRVDKPNAAYGTTSMRHETMREHPERRSVAQKCTFCVDRIDGGLAKGLTPGMDHEATPACVNSCIADALHFGDINDSTSNVSKLLAGNEHFRMHEEIGTGPNFFYLWKRKSANDGGEADLPVSEKPSTNMAAPMVAEPDGMNSVSPQLQTSWDWRAAANFIGGGTGTGLFAVASIGVIFSQMSLSPFEGANLTALVAVSLLALALVGMGLFCVWLEIGRPWRFLNVFLHAKLSWMTREAIAAIGFFALAGMALMTSSAIFWIAAAATGMVFLYCQGRILKAAKGIPAWRQSEIVWLIVVTGLTEGSGLFAAIAVLGGLGAAGFISLGLLILVLLRYVVWQSYRKSLGRSGAPTKTFKALDDGFLNLSFKSQLIVTIIVAASLIFPALLIPAGLLAAFSGWAFKCKLITRASYNQGYSINRMPVRGVGEGGPGIKPGWTLS